MAKMRSSGQAFQQLGVVGSDLVKDLVENIGASTAGTSQLRDMSQARQARVLSAFGASPEVTVAARLGRVARLHAWTVASLAKCLPGELRGSGMPSVVAW